MITDDTKLNREFDQALKDKKKYCLLPGGLATKVLFNFEVLKSQIKDTFFRALNMSP